MDEQIENGLASLVRQIGCYVKDRELLGKLHTDLKGIFEVFTWHIETIGRLSDIDLTRDELEALLIDIKVNVLERFAPRLRSLKKCLPLVLDAVIPDEEEDEDQGEDEDTIPTLGSTYKQVDIGLKSLKRQIRYYIKDEELLGKVYVYADLGDIFEECTKQIEAIGKFSNINLTGYELRCFLRADVGIGMLGHLVFHWRSTKKWLPLVLKEIAST